MSNVIKRLLGEGPYPFPISSDEFSKHLDIFYNDNFSILITKKPIATQRVTETHAHDSYEFTIPLSHNPLLTVDKKSVTVEVNKMIACNPGQLHGPGREMYDTTLMALQVEKGFMQEICRAIFGKNEIFFENEPVDISSNLRGQIRLYMEEARNKQIGYEFILETLEMQIVLMILRETISNISSKKTVKNAGKNNINRAIDFMKDNYNKKYSFEEIAEVANMSPYHFIRVFKKATGKRPHEFFTDIKVKKAAELLKNTSYSVTEICFLCGFNNHSYFSKIFKKFKGLTPSEYRKCFGFSLDERRVYQSRMT